MSKLIINKVNQKEYEEVLNLIAEYKDVKNNLKNYELRLSELEGLLGEYFLNNNIKSVADMNNKEQLTYTAETITRKLDPEATHKKFADAGYNEEFWYSVKKEYNIDSIKKEFGNQAIYKESKRKATLKLTELDKDNETD